VITIVVGKSNSEKH